jgi:hypothetical protein
MEQIFLVRSIFKGDLDDVYFKNVGKSGIFVISRISYFPVFTSNSPSDLQAVTEASNIMLVGTTLCVTCRGSVFFA